MKKSYLKDHERFLKKGLRVGLCGEYTIEHGKKDDPIFKLFYPCIDDEIGNSLYWAFGTREEYYNSKSCETDHKYTDLRQTIVLLMAAINGEL